MQAIAHIRVRAARLPIDGTTAAVMAWAGLIFGTHVWGSSLVARVPQTRIFAAPLVARFDPHVTASVLLPVAVAATALFIVPRAVSNLGWRRLLLLSFVAAASWAIAIALVDGVSELTRPLNLPNDYLRDVPLVGTPGAFLTGFVDRIARYHQHVRAHPPGMVLLLWTMDHLGLRGAGWAGALEILGGAAAAPAVLISLKEVAGERWARSAAPFVAFAPAAVWIATSADALFAGVTAWAVALLILSIHREGATSDALALAGGLLFGAAIFLTYGVTVLAFIPLMVAAGQGRFRPLVLAAAGTGMIVAGFGAAGFWWPAGLRATIAEYQTSVAQFRPQSYFWLGNLGAFAVVLGPATAAGFGRLRDRRVWLVAGAALATLAVADATGLSKAEVERIWLPFAPWILLAGAATVVSPTAGGADDSRFAWRMRSWLAVTMGAGLAIQLLLRTTW